MWTKENTERMAFLWENTTVSARLIGEELGMSKNAVIGKVHRMGLAFRGNPRLPARVHTANLIVFPPKGCCQWADADPTSLHFQFCGKKIEDLDGVWCPEHHARVYIKGSAAKVAAD